MMQDQAILGAVGELVTLAGVNIEAALTDVAHEAGEDDLHAALEVCQGSVETIAMAAEMAQLDGLQALCGAVTETLGDINGQVRARWSDLSLRLSAWNQAVQLYASQPDASGLTQPLLALVSGEQQLDLWLSLGGTEAGLAAAQETHGVIAGAKPDAPEHSVTGTTDCEPEPHDASEALRCESAPTEPAPADSVAPEPCASASVRDQLADPMPLGPEPVSIGVKTPDRAESDAPETVLGDAEQTGEVSVDHAEETSSRALDLDTASTEPVALIQAADPPLAPPENCPTIANEEELTETSELELAIPAEPPAPVLLDTAVEPEPPAASAPSLAEPHERAPAPDETVEPRDEATKPYRATDTETPNDIEPASATLIELMEILAELEPARRLLSDRATDVHEVRDACTTYAEGIDRLQGAAMGLGLNGLGIVCELMGQNIRTLAEVGPTARAEVAAQLGDWPSIVENLLVSPEQEEHQLAVLELLIHPSWPEPLAEEYAADLLSALALNEEQQEAELVERPTIAGPEDVALNVDPDVNPKLIEVFLQEGPQNAANFSARLEAVLRGEDVGRNLHDAQRLAHNLKGSANLLGIRGIANLTHHIEDILEYLDERHKAPQPALVATLQEAADCIEMMIEVLQGAAEAPANAQQILQEVLDWAKRMDAGALETPVATQSPSLEPAAAAAARPVHQEHTTAAPASASASALPQPSIADTAGQTNAGHALTPDRVLRVPQETVDTLLRMVGEVSIAIDHIHERMQMLRLRSNELQAQQDVVQQRRFALESYVDVRYLAGMQQRFSRMDRRPDFDPLEMDQYDELYTTIRGFVETVSDSRSHAQQVRDEIGALEHLVAPLRRMKGDLQRTLMSVRLEPVENIAARLQRSVRQACRATGKQAELLIEGGSTALDSEALDRLADPLMHMLRNAVDHGIEPPEERRAIGKPETGKIRLRFAQEGQNVLVECVDDGGGLDYEGIRRTAAARGLQANTSSPQDLARLILLPGFSTRTSATQVSGRGVGMDVVNTAIRALKGVMEIGDGPEGGCRIGLRLPITLMTSHSLVVKAQGEPYAIPTSAIARVLSPGDGIFSHIGTAMTYEIDRQAYPAVSLAGILGLPADSADELPNTSAVVLVYTDRGPVAVAVDQLLNSYHLVLKSLGRYVSSVRGVAGMSNLADGTLIPVLDMPELLRGPGRHDTALAAVRAEMPAEAAPPTAVRRVLVVDDSLSVRQTLCELLEDAGYQVTIARDGVEAVDALRRQPPDLVLSDIEMPRMNGLDLVHYIRTSHSATLPVIMISSRTMQKHRQQAKEAGATGYVTKPFNEDALLTEIRGYFG